MKILEGLERYLIHQIREDHLYHNNNNNNNYKHKKKDSQTLFQVAIENILHNQMISNKTIL